MRILFQARRNQFNKQNQLPLLLTSLAIVKEMQNSRIRMRAKCLLHYQFHISGAPKGLNLNEKNFHHCFEGSINPGRLPGLSFKAKPPFNLPASLKVMLHLPARSKFKAQELGGAVLNDNLIFYGQLLHYTFCDK